jgi:hypothetical protein
MNRFRPAKDKTDREMIRDRTDRTKTIRDTEEPMRCILLRILKNHSIWLFKKESQMGNKTLDELADISTQHHMIPELLSCGK